MLTKIWISLVVSVLLMVPPPIKIQTVLDVCQIMIMIIQMMLIVLIVLIRY